MAITLTRKSLKLEDGNSCRQNWSIEVTATSDDPNLDARIFVYHAVADDDPIQSDSFSNVASLQDINIIPPDAPTSVPGADGTENYIPYYRVATVTFDCYTAAEAERIWRIVQIDTKNLVKEYNSSRKLTNDEVVTYE